MADADPVIVELTVAAPIEEVWRALREPAELRRWHGWDYDGFDREIEMIYLDGVTASDADRVLDTRGGGRFALLPDGDMTTVRLTRAAPEGATSWDGVYDEVNEGWTTFLQQLRCYLERHRGEERRSANLEREVSLPAGEPWFHSAHQTGVVLPSGALVTVARGRTVVNAWGVNEAAFAQLLEGLG